jgi:hypothetical protein
MYEYRQIIYRLQQGQKARAIHRDGLANREKIKDIKKIADLQGWLSPGAILPDEVVLQNFFAKRAKQEQSLKVAPYRELIKAWVQQGVQAKTIHQHLRDNYGFSGTYKGLNL